MSTRIGPTTDQALSGATAGHRMAGMEPSPEAVEITRRFADGYPSATQSVRSELSAADHFRAMRKHRGSRITAPYRGPLNP